MQVVFLRNAGKSQDVATPMQKDVRLSSCGINKNWWCSSLVIEQSFDWKEWRFRVTALCIQTFFFQGVGGWTRVISSDMLKSVRPQSTLLFSLSFRCVMFQIQFSRERQKAYPTAHRDVATPMQKEVRLSSCGINRNWQLNICECFCFFCSIFFTKKSRCVSQQWVALFKCSDLTLKTWKI